MKQFTAILVIVSTLLVSFISKAGIIKDGHWESDGTIINYSGENANLKGKQFLSWTVTDELSINKVLDSDLVKKDGWSVATSDVLGSVMNDFFGTSQFDEVTGRGKRLAIDDMRSIDFASVFGVTFYDSYNGNDLSYSAAWTYNIDSTKLFAATVNSEYQVFSYTALNSSMAHVRDYSLRSAQFNSMSNQFGVALYRDFQDIAPSNSGNTGNSGNAGYSGDPVAVSEPTGMAFAMLAAFPFLFRMRRSKK
jgi:hypothetical protein